jgi:putative endonuclease
MSSQKNWYLYVLYSKCLNWTYVGVTNDVGRRLSQHNGNMTGGAKTTRRGRPWIVASQVGPMDKSKAHSLEHKVKRAPGSKRVELANSISQELESARGQC